MSAVLPFKEDEILQELTLTLVYDPDLLCFLVFKFTILKRQFNPTLTWNLNACQLNEESVKLGQGEPKVWNWDKENHIVFVRNIGTHSITHDNNSLWYVEDKTLMGSPSVGIQTNKKLSATKSPRDTLLKRAQHFCWRRHSFYFRGSLFSTLTCKQGNSAEGVKDNRWSRAD